MEHSGTSRPTERYCRTDNPPITQLTITERGQISVWPDCIHLYSSQYEIKHDERLYIVNYEWNKIAIIIFQMDFGRMPLHLNCSTLYIAISIVKDLRREGYRYFPEKGDFRLRRTVKELAEHFTVTLSKPQTLADFLEVFELKDKSILNEPLQVNGADSFGSGDSVELSADNLADIASTSTKTANL